MSAGQRPLRWFLTAFGLVCVGIALTHIAFGPSSIPGSVPVNATMDSEDRFYATLFLGFGLAHVWAARDLTQRAGIVLAMQAVFFAGGIARIISLIAVGPPIPLFLFLGALELLIPPLVWWALRKGA
jgi:Domain of unknown function (DUF4345)